MRFLIVPFELNCTPTKGVDDYFSSSGTLDGLEAAATFTEPDIYNADDSFTDARLAEAIADEVLANRFVWSKPLGWLRWTGKVWKPTTDERVGEALRKYVVGQFKNAVERGSVASSLP